MIMKPFALRSGLWHQIFLCVAYKLNQINVRSITSAGEITPLCSFSYQTHAFFCPIPSPSRQTDHNVQLLTGLVPHLDLAKDAETPL